MKKYTLFLFVLLLASCSCQKKLAKLRYKCPELFITDTVTKTVTIPEYHYDTFYYYPEGYTFEMPHPDTPLIVPVTGARITGEIILDAHKVSANLTVPADTVTVEVPVEKIMPCNREHLEIKDYKKQKRQKWFCFFAGIGVVGLLIVARKFISIYFKK